MESAQSLRNYCHVRQCNALFMQRKRKTHSLALHVLRRCKRKMAHNTAIERKTGSRDGREGATTKAIGN